MSMIGILAADAIVGGHRPATRTRALRARRATIWSAVLAATTIGLLVLAGSASASLDVFYSEVGALKLSVDASGTNGQSATIQVDKPAGAHVRRAFLFAASTGFTGFQPPNGEVSLDGTAIDWDPDHTLANGISSYNVATDVTALVKPKVDAAPTGRVDFTVAETDSSSMDGEILVVILDDPAAKVGTVTLMYGAQQTTGDAFALGLAEPLKPSGIAQVGLGISYGFQPNNQYSQIDVNGVRLTTSAGGYDDGEGVNGALITAGGLDDDPANPPDPNATDACGPLCDDELYDLRPFVSAGASSIDVNTLNPSDDDNIFLAAFVISAVNTVGEGVALSPGNARTQVGNPFAFNAIVRDAHGDPVTGKSVRLRIVSGPNAGSEQQATTDARGRAAFSYLSLATGTDVLRASYVDGAGGTHTSNDLNKTWIPVVNGTFGGSWPYTSGPLRLYYSYGGGHQYRDAVTQSAENWNDSGAHVNISQWPSVPAALHVPIVDVRVGDDWAGYSLFPDNECTICGYSQVVIELNRDFLDGQGEARRTKTVTHEMGHVLGITHPDGVTGNETPSVMWGGQLEGHTKMTPQAFDTSRVNGLYP
jgi:hypothetical protein